MRRTVSRETAHSRSRIARYECGFAQKVSAALRAVSACSAVKGFFDAETHR